jgi:hypothetical protein
MPVFMIWKPQPNQPLPPHRVAQELEWGEEVPGLVDLPVREILDRIKRDFPDAEETAGLVARKGSDAPFEVTWTWQFVRFQCDKLAEADRQKLDTLALELGCVLYERPS